MYHLNLATIIEIYKASFMKNQKKRAVLRLTIFSIVDSTVSTCKNVLRMSDAIFSIGQLALKHHSCPNDSMFISVLLASRSHCGTNYFARELLNSVCHC